VAERGKHREGKKYSISGRGTPRASFLADARELVSDIGMLPTLGELYDIVIKLQWPWRASVGLLSKADPRALVSWITWMAILVAWPLVGLGVAYSFGCFICRAEALGNASDLIPPIGSSE